MIYMAFMFLMPATQVILYCMYWYKLFILINLWYSNTILNPGKLIYIKKLYFDV